MLGTAASPSMLASLHGSHMLVTTAHLPRMGARPGAQLRTGPNCFHKGLHLRLAHMPNMATPAADPVGWLGHMQMQTSMPGLAHHSVGNIAAPTVKRQSLSSKRTEKRSHRHCSRERRQAWHCKVLCCLAAVRQLTPCRSRALSHISHGVAWTSSRAMVLLVITRLTLTMDTSSSQR